MDADRYTDCADVRALLPDYLRRRLPAETQTAVRQHLAACPACAEAFEDERDFSALIGETDAAPPVALLPGVMAQVRREPRLPAFRVGPWDILLTLAGTLAAVGTLFGVGFFLAVLPVLVPDAAAGLALFADWLPAFAPVLAWSVPGLLVTALITLALQRTFTRRGDRTPLGTLNSE